VELVLIDTVSGLDDKKVLEIHSCDNCLTIRLYLLPLNCISKNG
jgi:hypothetical protein